MSDFKLLDRVYNQTVSLTFAGTNTASSRLASPFEVHEIRVTAFPSHTTANNPDGVCSEMYCEGLVEGAIAVVPFVDTEAVTFPSLPQYRFTFQQPKTVNSEFRFELKINGVGQDITGGITLHFEFIGQPFKLRAM